MPYILMDGKKTRDKVLENLKEQVKDMDITPCLLVISSGDDSASKVYINNKRKACEAIGAEFREIHIDPTGKGELKLYHELRQTIEDANDDYEITGIIVQSPVAGISKELEKQLFNIIDHDKDVDAFSNFHVSSLYNDTEDIISCTPVGILTLLDTYNIDVTGKEVVIVGRSNIVGKPLALALINRDATVTVCHSKTKDLKSVTRRADILISAVGKANLIDASYIKDDIEAIIDVGMNRDDGGNLCGDVYINDILEKFDFQEEELDDTKVHYITPVPGGVGPMTVASLMRNLVTLTKIFN